MNPAHDIRTVWYRMNQLRVLFGDRLTDPDAVLELIIAVASPDKGDLR